MCKKIIFGDINKKLLLPVLVAIGQVIINIFNKYYPEKESNFVLQLYSVSLGQIAIIFVPYILRIHNIVNKSNNEELHQKKFLNYFILCSLKAANIVTIFLGLIVRSKVEEDYLEVKSPKSTETFFELGIQMFLLAFISFFLLKYKYYIHNIISLIFFVISSLGSDLIVGYFQLKIKENYLSIIMDYIYILTDCILLCYEKYMMQKLYYSYWNIYFVLGLLLFGIASIALIAILIMGKESDIKYAKGFFNYFENTNIEIIIGKQLVTVVLYFFQCSLFISTLFYFTPEYILISLEFSRLTNLLIDKSSEENHTHEYLYFIILFIFQIFCLLIYLEIIELNFCGLNWNTRKNIGNRGLEEHFFGNEKDTDISGIINVSPDYYFDETLIEKEEDESSVELKTSKKESDKYTYTDI